MIEIIYIVAIILIFTFSAYARFRRKKISIWKVFVWFAEVAFTIWISLMSVIQFNYTLSSTHLLLSEVILFLLLVLANLMMLKSIFSKS